MDPAATPPFTGLTPDAVLDALESVGLRGDGRLLGLNSYENRVYQVWLEDGSSAATVVAKFYRNNRWSDEAILEEHAFTSELQEADLPVVPPLHLDSPGGSSTLHTFNGFRFAVFPKRGGRAPELENRKTLEWIGRSIGRLHAIGAQKPFEHREVLGIRSLGEESRDWLMASDFIPVELAEAYSTVTAQALDGVRRGFERAGDVKSLRLHGDCHAGNILWTDRGEMPGPHFVDFDDSRMGPAMQDLWMLLPGDDDEVRRQLAALLSGYEDFYDFDRRELFLIEPLRTLRLMHYSAWLARRWDDPAFPAAFPWFNTQRYWQDRILELREQIALMNEAPVQA